ncbi:hypothetical protein SCUCBS95973_003561 [Sporothrix curviconia]|uniref:Glucan 4-alpha-glucosidase n=1 Tax=Sporothrix curviconia TaxID=1260050 RepID=A0ABP0BGG7_9PEZI
MAMDIMFPSTMTATPPLSAGPVDPTTAQPPQVFCFSPDDIQRHNFRHGVGEPEIIISSGDGHLADGNLDTAITDSCSESSFAGSETVDTPFPSDIQASPPQPEGSAARRRITAPAIMMPKRPAPYVHPRALHSILRNSPLPPFTALSPTSTRRKSQRLIEKASRHVMYNSPLTQTITTNLYTKSHIDLLCEEASPFSSPMTTTPGGSDADTVLDLTLAYTGNETRDGGTTPGPFEEMRRRMAGLGTSSASSSTATTPITPGGIRKRKQPRKDKKRRWVWTLGQDEEEEATLSGAMAALKAAQKAEAAAVAAAAAATPTPTAASAAGIPEATMTGAPDIHSDAETDVDLKTPRALQPPFLPVYEAQVSQDVEMQDSGAGPIMPTDVATVSDSAPTATPPRPVEARKRKSTPTPYATDSEGDSGVDDDGDDDQNIIHDIDVDMQTPTTALGNHLQGAWLRAATMTAARPRTTPAAWTAPQ